MGQNESSFLVLFFYAALEPRALKVWTKMLIFYKANS